MIKADLINIKMDNEISDKLSNKLVTVISTLIGTQVTAAYASVDAATVITQGDINTHKLEVIDATHQLQSIVKNIHNFTNVGKKGKKSIAAGQPPHLKDFLMKGALRCQKMPGSPDQDFRAW